jgi:serine protease
MNTVIPVSPFRVYDSRPTARPANSVTNITIAGVGGVPADAVGVFGNLTALGPAADGFLTMYPAGQGVPGVNSLNYTRGVSAVSNFVMVLLGTGGQVSVYVSGNGATNVIFDVGGYIQ